MFLLLGAPMLLPWICSPFRLKSFHHIYGPSIPRRPWRFLPLLVMSGFGGNTYIPFYPQPAYQSVL